MNKKLKIGIMAILMIAMIGAVSAQMVSSSDPQDPFPAKFYISKYAPPDAPMSSYGRVTIHSGSSPLTQVTNDHDYWPPVAYITNNADPKQSVGKIVFGMDSTVSDIYTPGDFTVTYRYCTIPVKINVGEETIIGLPVCDR